MALIFGEVPLPPHQYRPIVKPANFGQNDLGPRDTDGAVLHTMQGTLWGTDSYFRLWNVAALTDFGIDPTSGEVLKWNEPDGGRQSGWASGPVSSPYGDGLAFLNSRGWRVNDVNKDQVSLEIGGYFDPNTGRGKTPLGSKAKQHLAQITAHYFDRQGYPWTSFPNVPQGFSFVRWHQEYTIGTGKLCPGSIVMEATPEIIDMTGKILKDYQEDGVLGPVSPAQINKYVTPTPGPIWIDNHTAIKVGDVVFWPCRRQVKITRPTNARAWAHYQAPYTRQPMRVGEAFETKWMVEGEGGWWYVTPRGSRIKASFTDQPDLMFRTNWRTMRPRTPRGNENKV